MTNRNKAALRFVILLGLVSLFADITYESARSLTGQYLAVLGAGAVTIGAVAGLGELVGYGLRIVSGLITDRTRRYWTVTIVGYAVNVLAVPAMALAGRWEIAAALIIAERLGKAIRTPSRDAMLSHATQAIGRGWGFALHEAMDQIGAITGPLIVTVVFALKGSYSWTFGILILPAVIALLVLTVARIVYPTPQDLETGPPAHKAGAFAPPFWLYLLAMALVAAAFADYPLIAYHFRHTAVLEEKWIPVLYALAMAVDALSALFFGWLYDRIALPALMLAFAISAFFAPFAFSGKLELVIFGVVLWGIGLGAQESVMRAVVAGMVPADRRATGYGIFNAAFGFAWFLGSALMGLLYDLSLPALAAFSVLAQIASLPLILIIHNRINRPS